MRRLLGILILIVALGVIPGLGVDGQGERPLIHTIRLEGPIEPSGAVYVGRSINVAEENNAQALIILLETPGGLDDSMRAIIKDIFASRVPVVVYVSPKGARAASAGAIITLAGHVAAMSPGTAMGAAHPVAMGGDQPDDVMSQKMENDAAAYARSIAQQRGRNVEWAELAVRESVSATEVEAREKNIIDLIATDLDDLLAQINGRTVTTAAGEITINTENARVEPIDPVLRERFLRVIANPNIAYILMLIAVYGIIFELNNPGAILPGVIGGIALILALFSFAVLPINLTGVLLIVLGLALLVGDLFVPGAGILTLGGIVAFIVGSIILFETDSPVFRVSIVLVLTMAALTASFFLFAVGAAWKAQQGKVITGVQGMVDQVVEARTDINPNGKVFVEGSYWNAVTENEPIKKGELVRITAVDKLHLRVRKEA